MIIFLREKFIAQLFMWVIAIVFVVGSILLYSSSSGQRDGPEADVVLKIKDLEVRRDEFEQRITNTIESRRNQRFGNTDRETAQEEVIANLIQGAILSSAPISDAEVERYIRSDENLLAQYNQLEESIAARLREQVRYYLSATTLQNSIRTLELVTDAEVEQAYQLEANKAKIKFVEFKHHAYTPTVEIDEVTAQAYLEKNAEHYKTDQQIRAKLIEVRPADFVSDSDVQDYYKTNQSRFMTVEAVKARHILKKFPDNATDEQKAEVKAAAETLLKTVKTELAAGKTFADLAKTHSEGPSGEQGGALRGGNPKLPDGDYFARGDMVEPFEAACFDTLKPGEVSDLVETVFGYHIIQLEEKKAPEVQPLAQVQSEIREKLVKISGVESAKSFADDLIIEIEMRDYDTALALDKYKTAAPTVKETAFFSQTASNIPEIGSAIYYRGLTDELFDMELNIIKKIETKNFRGEVTAYFVATVLEKKSAGIPEFADVKAQVIDDMREQKAKELALADAQKLFSQRTENESLEALLKKYKTPEGITAEALAVQESNLFNLTAGSSYVSGMGNAKDVMFAAFNMEKGDVQGPFAGETGTYIIELVEREEADIELFQTDPAEKTKRLQTLLQGKKQKAYDNWFAARKNRANPWIHEDYR